MNLGPAEKIKNTLLAELSNYTIDSPGALGGINACLDLVTAALRQLRQWAHSVTFSKSESTIVYFRDIQAVCESKLLFYAYMLQIEQYVPAVGRTEKARYYRRQFQRAERFYKSIPDYFGYYRSGATHMDSVYFTLSPNYRHPSADPVTLLLDARLTTPKSYQHARILAYEALTVYLDLRVWHLQSAPFHQNETNLQWQLSKTALAELIYALSEMRAFGPKVTDIKRVAEFLQSTFHVQLTNIYSTYEDIRLRKKNRTPFLDQLKAALERRLDHDDLHAP